MNQTLNNQEESHCSECGAKLQSYKVGLTPILVRALIKFKRAIIDKGENEVHLLKDMKGKPYELTRHEWNNFTRQRFHALAVKTKDKTGYWLLTRKGNQFLMGQIEVSKYVKVYRNKVVSHSEEQVSVHDVLKSTPYLEQKDDIEYDVYKPRQTDLI